MPKKTIPCEKCGSEMERSTTINSGGSKFDVFNCTSCSHQTLRALGQ